MEKRSAADARFVHQIGDEFQLVQAFEVGHLGGANRLRRELQTRPGRARWRRRRGRTARRTNRFRFLP